jgi:hypothetical protein
METTLLSVGATQREVVWHATFIWCIGLWTAACGSAVVARQSGTPKCENELALEQPPPQIQIFDGLEFQIEPAGPPVASSRIRFRLRNVSDRSIWANTRMLTGSSLGEVSIEVAPSGNGKPLELDCRVHPAMAQYVLLTPGSEISVAASLGCLQFPNEGPWRLTATYRDKMRRIPRPPSGAVWFAGTLKSNELEFYARP